MNMLMRSGTALVYANFGRWVAECPCSSATEFGTPGNPPMLASAWLCVECGDRVEAIWPSLEMMYGVERLLLMRRYRKNQNWFPNETLNDLHEENMVNGVYGFVGQMEPPPDGPLLMVTDTEVRADVLPQINPRRELRMVER